MNERQQPMDGEGDRQIGPQTRLDLTKKKIAKSSYSSSRMGTANGAAPQPRRAALPQPQRISFSSLSQSLCSLSE